nr:AbfB domain-containing protein [Corallococcus sicarius]
MAERQRRHRAVPCGRDLLSARDLRRLRLGQLQSFNMTGHFLRHRDFELWVEPGTSLSFERDSTFRFTTR